jgi:hypothetical protein
MMLNKMPPNTPLDSILTYLEKDERWGSRNRALFAVRQRLRIKDIANLKVIDLLNLDGSIRHIYLGSDGVHFMLDADVRRECERYLKERFELPENALCRLLGIDLRVPVFPTQKRQQFSPNTLAQHFSALDKDISQHFKPKSKRATKERRSLKAM